MTIFELGKNCVSSARVIDNKKTVTLIRRAKKELSEIRETYLSIQSAPFQGEGFTAVQWLSDNFYLSEREGRNAIKEIGLIQRLPVLSGGTFYKLPAMYFYMRELVKFCNCLVQEKDMAQFISALESTRPFTTRELFSLPAVLRLAIISEIARIGPLIGDREKDGEAASTLESCFKTLRFLAVFDYSKLLGEVSAVETILNQDPAGVYPRMEERSKAYYRRVLEKSAKKKKISEVQEAKNALHAASKYGEAGHVGTYLIREKSRLTSRLYLASVIILTIFLTAFITVFAGWLAIFALLPLWQCVKMCMDALFLKWRVPYYVVRMELLDLPDNAKTMAVISCLLTSIKAAENLAKQCEQYFLANQDENLTVALLWDYKDSDRIEDDGDEVLREAARTEIVALNQKYGEHFAFFLRHRSYNARQNKYMGWERKRGAILHLVRFIKGTGEFDFFEGNREKVQATKYIIALDSDTSLPIDSVRNLVGAMIHPLNTPVLGENGIVVKGYGLLQPRVGIHLKSANTSLFSKFMAGHGGIDNYSNTVSDIYQDLFNSSTFCGKGIFDVDCYFTVIDELFPENRILSHDLLEGAFLRTGLISDVELCDGYPSSVLSYFDRQHRWVRGDVQTMPYVKRTVRKTNGDKMKNPLRFLTKWQIVDNLKTALYPASSVLFLILSSFGLPFLKWLGLSVFLLPILSPLLISAAGTFISGNPAIITKKYYSEVLPGWRGTLLRTGYLIISALYHGRNSLDAVLRASYRLFFSKKNLLSWVTAAESEKKKGTLAAYFIRMLPEIFVGLLLVLFVPFWPAKILGALWSFSFLFGYLVSKRTEADTKELTTGQKTFLREICGEMWGYYRDFINEENSFLPPDNFQASPSGVIAHRTSPTNIGIGLLCILAARDFELISTKELYERLCASIETVEKMEKWQGHLYNWYRTTDLSIMQPAYVSSVDSGNFAACLITLRQGITQYSIEYPALASLIPRLTAMISGMQFCVFYNEKRKLFHVGYDAQSGKLGDSYYDLLMSEARTLSYIAVARREVERRHWFSLMKTVIRKKGYTGLASWSGTMFEYFMPSIFLPVYENSLLFESLRFALACQKDYAEKKKVPFGISESGFYSFDSALNFQYKAFGVPKLALKRGRNEELVISPYSSFLTLTMDCAGAIDNLRLLQEIGARGEYGFFEAVDYTEARVDERAVVQSYMAHHVGMSFLMCCNALYKNIMVNRFLSDAQMGCATELLQERLLYQATEFRDVMKKEEAPERLRAPQREPSFFTETPNLHHVTGTALSNGSGLLMITDLGYGFSAYGNLFLYRFRNDRVLNPKGLFLAVKGGETILPCTAAPVFDRFAKYSVELSGGFCRHVAQKDMWETTVTTLLHPSLPGEMREVRLKNNSEKANWQALCYFEPSLAQWRDDEAHPAFQNLFLESEYDKNILYFSRRPRQGTGYEYLAVAVQGDGRFTEFETMGENLRDGFTTNEITELFNASFSSSTGALVNPVCVLRILGDPLSKGELHFSVVTAYGQSKAACRETIDAIKKEGFPRILSAAQDVAQGKKATAGLQSSTEVFQILPALWFGSTYRCFGAAADSTRNQRELWKYCISGDKPIILVEIFDEEDLGYFKSRLQLYHYLTLCKVDCDLVVMYGEGGEYGRPLYQALTRMVAQTGCDVHFVDRLTIPKEDEVLLLAAAAVCWNKNEKPEESEVLWRDVALPVRIKERRGGNPAEISAQSVLICRDVIHKKPWSNVLANSRFGTVLTDGSLGYTFSFNARENKLTQWTNDLLAPSKEHLYLSVNGKLYDICRESHKTLFGAGYGKYFTDIDGIQIETTCFVPTKLAVKIMQVHVNCEKTAEISYLFQPVLGVNGQDSRYVSGEKRGTIFYFKNPYNINYHGTGFALCDREYRLCCDKASFYAGVSCENGLPQSEPCVSLTASVNGQDQTFTFVLGYGNSERELEYTLRTLYEKGIDALLEENITACTALSTRASIQTGDRGLDTLCSFYFPYQTLFSRIFARTGLYQCGGAFGYRDQLQDALSLLYTAPKRLRRQIIRCAVHQFEAGDVQHWWHNLSVPNGMGHPGVRTKCSDDLLWLPYCTARYCTATGEEDILDTELPYLIGEELNERDDLYFQPEKTMYRESIYVHSKRALDRAFRQGVHGLLLIMGGDWNDGMNRVGNDISGESVWLAMFYIITAREFANLAQTRESGYAKILLDRADALEKAISENAWDGAWYLRGYYSDNAKLGSKESEECRIDLLSQAFAPLACPRETAKNKQGLDSVYNKLCDFETGLVKLFDPPFATTKKEPGYIKGYVAGIRENGGQYTHGAIWMAMGFFAMGDGNRGFTLLKTLNPYYKAETREKLEQYKNEPYVLSADIYTNPAHYGEGGWSWYTGAAAWYMTVVFQYFLGLKLERGKLTISPCLPDFMDGYSLKIRLLGRGIYDITVKRGDPYCMLDGQKTVFPIEITEGSHLLTVYY